MPDDSIDRFMIRFEGGPRDGVNSGSTFVDQAELPPSLLVEGHVYELASFSRLPPVQGVIRGALYRYRGPAPEPEVTR